MPFAGKQVEVEIVMLRKKGQAQKDRHVFSLYLERKDLKQKRRKTINRKKEGRHKGMVNGKIPGW